VTGLMHIVLGTASLMALLVLGPRRTWRHALHALRERANTSPNHSQAIAGSQSASLLDQEIETNGEKDNVKMASHMSN
jgi:hypothetical protein